MTQVILRWHCWRRHKSELSCGANCSAKIFAIATAIAYRGSKSAGTKRRLTFDPPRALMCLLTTMKKDTPLIYDSLCTINRSFEQILTELERVEQLDWFRGCAPLKAVGLAVRETRAWTISEILDVLHQREERGWMRLGRIRNSEDERFPRRASARTKPTGRTRRAAPRV